MLALVHGDNLANKENGSRKYTAKTSQRLLKEIRQKYDRWHQSNMELIGPRLETRKNDREIVYQRVELLNQYKEFIDQSAYAEHFDSRSRLHSTVIEEFLCYLFKDLVAEFGKSLLIGSAYAFKDLFFVPPNFRDMLLKPFAHIETKDHDFVIGVRIEARLTCGSLDEEYGSAGMDKREVETHTFDVPAIAIECKTYLDKTMLERASRAAEELKARNPNAMYIMVMERIKLSEDVNLQKFKVDQIYVLRKERNVDREFRLAPDFETNPIQADVVYHLFETVRSHLSGNWQSGVETGMDRGWLYN